MKAINPNIYPKDGYRFRDTDGSWHHADSWAGVINRVKAYRQRQGKPVDTVHDEVINQACQRNPILCSEESIAYKENLKHASLKSRVLAWLGWLRTHRDKVPLVFVNDALHAARVDVCSRCPKNTALPEGCSSCRAALKELSGDLIGRRGLDGRVTACIVLGEYLPVSTWIEMPSVPNQDLHWECWRKRTL